MATTRHRFFLQAIDPDLGCPVLEAVLDVAVLDELRALLGSCADDDPELRRGYVIDAAELAAISERFGVAFDPGERDVRLVPWHSLREAPYLVHTHYELPLLLEGGKQLARMCEYYPPHLHDGEHYFDRYVAEGLLHKEVSLELFDSSHRLNDGSVIEGLRSVYYTRKGEEWRIQAWKLISAASRKSGWNQAFERLEGMLYGYEEWQMEWWINRFRERKVLVRNEVEILDVNDVVKTRRCCSPNNGFSTRVATRASGWAPIAFVQAAVRAATTETPHPIAVIGITVTSYHALDLS